MRTILYDAHCELGAKMIEFGGWEMPVSYAGVLREHEAVRTAAGLFDVSHMGEFLIRGPSAQEFLERVSTNSVSALGIGQIQYAMLLNQRGGIIDDCTIYGLDGESFLMVVNAANIEKDLRWLKAHGIQGMAIENVSEEVGLLALQGPRSKEIMAACIDSHVLLEQLRYYYFADSSMRGIAVRISRTGYTGEDGFEIFSSADDVSAVWRMLLDAGAARGILPCGLGARDTLRLEAGMRLHGNDIDETITPMEAGLERFVCFGKPGGFIGEESLVARKEKGIERKLIGFIMDGREIARAHYAIFAPDGVSSVGVVTSGTFSPTLKKSIGMGYVNARYGETNTNICIRVRDKNCPARIVPLPFYRRQRKERRRLNENSV